MPTCCSTRSPTRCWARWRWAISAAHFPDSDPRWKGADSRALLRHAFGLAQSQGWQLANVDATIIAEAAEDSRRTCAQMRAHIAQDLQCAEEQRQREGDDDRAPRLHRPRRRHRRAGDGAAGASAARTGRLTARGHCAPPSLHAGPAGAGVGPSSVPHCGSNLPDAPIMPNAIAAATPSCPNGGRTRRRRGCQSAARPWDTPYGLAAVRRRSAAHFRPAFDAAWRAHRDELDAIAADPRAPDFDNTVAAFDRAGELLTRINTLFGNLAAAETSPELQAVERDVAPLQAAHDSATYMHPALFARIDALHARRDALGLDPEQAAAARSRAPRFRSRGRQARAGGAAAIRRDRRAARDADDAVRAERARRRGGVPAGPVHRGRPGRAARLAARLGAAGGDRPRDSPMPGSSRCRCRRSSRSSPIRSAATCASRRRLAWSSRGGHAGASDNRPLVAEILRLRLEQARLHGYASYADYALADRMARTPPAVDALLERVWAPAKARAAAEAKELSALAREHGDDRAGRALGLALLGREGAADAVPAERRRGDAVLLPRRDDGGDVRLRQSPVRHLVRSPAGHRHLSPGRARLRGARP